MLRLRDFIAVGCGLLLYRLSYSYSQGSESLLTSVDLSFFAEFTSHIKISTDAHVLSDFSRTGHSDSTSYDYDYKISKPVALDLDGDGVVEAIVVAHNFRQNKNPSNWYWGLKVLDLKPIHVHHPNMKRKSPINPEVPHYLNPMFTFPTQETITSESGSESESGSYRKQQQQGAPVKIITGQMIPHPDTKHSYATNPMGALPIIATVWSNGHVTLHCITTTTTIIDTQGKGQGDELSIVELWDMNAVNENGNLNVDENEDERWIDFVEVDLILVPGLDLDLDPDAPMGRNGALIVALHYNADANAGAGATPPPIDAQHEARSDRPSDDHHDKDKETPHKSHEHSLYIALDAWTGEALWRKHTDLEKNDGVRVHEVDCLHHYEEPIRDKSVGGILPHSSWQRNVPKGMIDFDTRLHIVQGVSTRRSVMFHSRDGMISLSLSDGEEVCRSFLLKNTMYADIDQDGTVDRIQLSFEEDEEGESSDARTQAHIYFRNGSKDPNNDDYDDEVIKIDFGVGHGDRVSVAPPLLVEGGEGDGASYNGGHDMVYALNNGMIKRYGTKGELIWIGKGHIADMPGWDDTAGVNHGYLDRITFTGALDDTRPIVWFGDDKFSILTSGRGRLLESIQFPQTIVGRPLLVDFNADGTTDILITSVDGIWGYCVTISTSTSTFLKIMNGFLVLFLTLCFLLGYFDSQTHEMRRSTDP